MLKGPHVAKNVSISSIVELYNLKKKETSSQRFQTASIWEKKKQPFSFIFDHTYFPRIIQTFFVKQDLRDRVEPKYKKK